MTSFSEATFTLAAARTLARLAAAEGVRALVEALARCLIGPAYWSMPRLDWERGVGSALVVGPELDNKA